MDLWILLISLLVAANAEIPSEQTGRLFAFDEFLVGPLRVHLLSSEQPALQTTLTDRDVKRVIRKVNRIWAQAGIHFYLESVVREEAASDSTPATESRGDLRGLLAHVPAASHDRNVFNVYYIKQFAVNGVFLGKAIFVKDTASLRPVPGAIDEPLPRVTSHELGHALGLPHREERTNLMASGTTGTALNDAEIDRARGEAKLNGRFVSAPDLLAKGDALRRDGRPIEARIWYRKLVDLPIEVEPLPRVRQFTSD